MKYIQCVDTIRYLQMQCEDNLIILDTYMQCVVYI